MESCPTLRPGTRAIGPGSEEARLEGKPVAGLPEDYEYPGLGRTRCEEHTPLQGRFNFLAVCLGSAAGASSS